MWAPYTRTSAQASQYHRMLLLCLFNRQRAVIIWIQYNIFAGLNAFALKSKQTSTRSRTAFAVFTL